MEWVYTGHLYILHQIIKKRNGHDQPLSLTFIIYEKHLGDGKTRQFWNNHKDANPKTSTVTFSCSLIPEKGITALTVKTCESWASLNAPICKQEIMRISALLTELVLCIHWHNAYCKRISQGIKHHADTCYYHCIDHQWPHLVLHSTAQTMASQPLGSGFTAARIPIPMIVMWL